MTVEFRVLGEVEAIQDGRPVALGHARQVSVLAILLVEANRTVSVDQLVERVWAERPPHKPRDALYGYVYRLRQTFAETDAVAIKRGSGGYRLTIDPLAVDLHRFEHVLALARAAEDERKSLALFNEALGMWRSDAFHGLDSPWLDDLRNTFDRRRFQAETDRTDLALRQGEYSNLLAVLPARAQAHPLDERVMGQLMLALHLAGRSADALDRYHQIRRKLADELGTDPGEPLQDLYATILAQTRLTPSPSRVTSIATPRAPTTQTAGQARKRGRLTIAVVCVAVVASLAAADASGSIYGDRSSPTPTTSDPAPIPAVYARIRPTYPHAAGLLCLSAGVDRSSRSSRPIAVLRDCAKATPPRTAVESRPDGVVRIWWYHPDEGWGCLTVIESPADNGYRLEPWNVCPAQKRSQQFRLEPVDSPVPGGFRLRPVGTDLCVGIVEPVALGAEAGQEACTGSDDQEFLIDREEPAAITLPG
ncbi:MAG TPA: BTAD domain-containing putative transcriptional regulator [Umezawaea sp.]|nr:BTAD domain-containing putative transcriptional regulator [Umezawaea sp.]